MAGLDQLNNSRLDCFISSLLAHIILVRISYQISNQQVQFILQIVLVMGSKPTNIDNLKCYAAVNSFGVPLSQYSLELYLEIQVKLESFQNTITELQYIKMAAPLS